MSTRLVCGHADSKLSSQGALISQQRPDLWLLCALATNSKVSTLSSLVATKIILDDAFVDSYIVENQNQLAKAYAQVVETLDRYNIQYLPASAGLFICVRLSESDDPGEERRIQEALRREKVALMPGSAYHFRERGWFRLSFALEPEVLVAGLERIRRAMERAHAEAADSSNEPGF